MTTAAVTRRRVDYTGWIEVGSSPVLTDYQGIEFYPYKIQVSVWPDTGKARVQVHGNMVRRRTETRTATFTLDGYGNYRPCPEWLVPVLRYLGYQGDILNEEQLRRIRVERLMTSRKKGGK